MSKVLKIVKLLSPMARKVEQIFWKEYTIQGDNWVINLFEFDNFIRIVFHRTLLITFWDYEPYRFPKNYKDIVQIKGRDLKLDRTHRSILLFDNIRMIYEVTVIDVPNSWSIRGILEVIFSFL